MLVPNHALYDAGTCLAPLAVFVSTTTASSYVALLDAYPAVGRSCTSYTPLPVYAACTAKPLPAPPVKPPAGTFDAASVPWLMMNVNGTGAGAMRSSRNTSVNVGVACTAAARAQARRTRVNQLTIVDYYGEVYSSADADVAASTGSGRLQPWKHASPSGPTRS